MNVQAFGLFTILFVFMSKFDSAFGKKDGSLIEWFMDYFLLFTGCLLLMGQL